MIFNPDASKQAHKVIFIRKIKETTHPLRFVNRCSLSLVNALTLFFFR